MNMFRLSSICAATLIATAAFAAPAPSTDGNSAGVPAQGTVVAREAESGDDHRGRGRGRDDRRLTDEAAGTQVAREAESGDDHRGRGRGRDDRRLSDDAATSAA